MIHVSEDISASLVTHEMAFVAVREALIAACDPASASFPVVLGHGSDPINRFTIKSGAGSTLAGLKVGSYFPGNDAIGQPRHNSLILLFDQARGRIGVAIEGGRLNAYRTAAADAVATDALARFDAGVLAVFGTGDQAEYEVAAVARIRNFRRVLAVGRSSDKAARFVERLNAGGLPAEVCTAEEACTAAAVIVTATTATEPLFRAEWVRPGTHISSMGSDRIGKQELPPELLQTARLFCDLPSQSRVIGEFQHAPDGTPLTAIGDVLSGKAPGRSGAEGITVFDSSGISLQDLFIANAVLSALRNGAKETE